MKETRTGVKGMPWVPWGSLPEGRKRQWHWVERTAFPPTLQGAGGNCRAELLYVRSKGPGLCSCTQAQRVTGYDFSR